MDSPRSTKVTERGITLPFWALAGILSAVAIMVYTPSFFSGYTHLDDYLLVNKAAGFNSHLSNLGAAFRRGALGGADHFYRPVLLDSFILNYQICGINITGYHVANVFLHAVAVVAFFCFLVTLQIQSGKAAFLAAIFAVHPAICQAVAWVPGRNEVLLTIWVLAFLNSSIRYLHNGKWPELVFAVLLFALAVFTKETGLVALLAVPIIAMIYSRKHLWNLRLLILTAAGIAVAGIWWYLRSAAHMVPLALNPLQLIKVAAYRAPLFLQYTGKIIFPLNLSVFPLLKDTTSLYGIVAIALMMTLLWVSKNAERTNVFAGLVLYLLFLLPLFFIPPYMSLQTFEHRLYLPLCFFLVMIGEVDLSAFVRGPAMKGIIAAILLVFTALNLNHQRFFRNAEVFWRQAVATTPSSPTAHMFLALYSPNENEQIVEIQNALKIDSNERFVNYNAGVIYRKRGLDQLAKTYLLKERAKTRYAGSDLLLYSIAVAEHDTPSQQFYDRSYFNKTGAHPQ